MTSKDFFRFIWAPSPFTLAERRWWQQLNILSRVVIAVIVAWSSLTILYAISDSCRRDQSSTACWVTNGSFAETVNQHAFGK